MLYILAFAVGAIAGCVLMVAILTPRQRRAERALEEAEATRRASEVLAQERLAFDGQRRKLEVERRDLDARASEAMRRESELNARIVTLSDLERENTLLKRDLQNVDVHLNKVRIDGEQLRERQDSLDGRSRSLARRYLAENVKAIGGAVSANNFTQSRDRLLEVIRRVREIGFEVSSVEEQALVSDLKLEFERAVRAAFEREEQARIKAQIREEEQLRREIDRELKQLDRERSAIQAALDRALADAEGRHNEEVVRLEARLAEAIAKSQRAISMAQQTKAGFVYVISNVGSFGEGVFKIGMTRRLEPLDRVHELGSASVPFSFDVHMMIKCEDAPRLENALHRAIHKSRINKVNPRKEFFRADVETIRRIVTEHHGEVEYVADAKALEYRQSVTMADDDAEYIERVFEDAEGAANSAAEDD